MLFIKYVNIVYKGLHIMIHKHDILSLKDYSSNRKIKSDFETTARIVNDYTSSLNEISGNTATFIITTPNPDRVNDIVEPSGLETSNYLKTNPVVLWQHDDSELPIGKCISLYTAPDGIIATVEFVDPDTPFVGPKAEAIFSLIKQGVLNAVSIGFNVTECFMNEYGGMTITEAELVEFSIVNVPCNRDAILIDHSEKTLTSESCPTVPQDYAGDDEKEFVSLPTAADKPDDLDENDQEENSSKKLRKQQIIDLEFARQKRISIKNH